MNCDRIAWCYRYLEYLVFGRGLERRRFEYLDECASARRVLVLGDGDGRFTAEFVRRYPEAVVDFVDLSERMVAQASRRVGSSGQVRFRVGDARTVELSGRYDLVVTHFFMDCFWEAELTSLVKRVEEQCEPGARWVVSEFGLPAAGVARAAARILIRFMYFCFWLTTGLRITRLPDYARVLAAHRFRVVSRTVAMGGLLVSELWELLRT